jgi:hypothetical protein
MKQNEPFYLSPVKAHRIGNGSLQRLTPEYAGWLAVLVLIGCFR